jgi:putative transposase
MKTDNQILSLLKQTESGVPVSNLCREPGISNALFYRWRSHWGGMDIPLIKRLKELVNENARLKKMYAGERLKAEIPGRSLKKSCKAIRADYT